MLRWRLFHRTDADGADARRLDANADEDRAADISALRATDYFGPERNPLPTNAARLFCILGDLESEPRHYERAWELSRHRFARAQRSLGEYYLRKQMWKAPGLPTRRPWP